MPIFFDFLTKIDRSLLSKAVDKALEGHPYDASLKAQVMTICDQPTVPPHCEDSVRLWAFWEDGSLQVRVICMNEDTMMDYNPAIVEITAQPIREYLEDVVFDSCEECLSWFLGMKLSNLRIDGSDRVAFAATVLRDIILGTSTPNPSEVTVTESEESYLNVLRSNELKTFLEDFSSYLPSFNEGRCRFAAKGTSREVGITIDVDSACAICGDEIDNSGFTAYAFGKRLCFYCAEMVYSAWGNYHRDHIDHCPHCQSKLALLAETDES